MRNLNFSRNLLHGTSVGSISHLSYGLCSRYLTSCVCGCRFFTAAPRNFIPLSYPTNSSLKKEKTSNLWRVLSRSFSSGEVEDAIEVSQKQPLTRYTPDQEALRESLHRCLDEVVAPRVKQMDKDATLEPEVLSTLFEQGYMSIEVPQEYGGSGMSFTDCMLVIEEIAKVDPAVAVIVDIQNTLINRCIYTYGTEEQKQKYLSKICEGCVGSFCLSEAESGSDAFALRTTATKVNDEKGGYQINGVKQWISNSKEAGLFIVFATVDPEKKHKGITAFLVDSDASGLQVGSSFEKLGIKASSTCEVTFENVYVPETNILGKVGEGYKIAIECLNEGRIGIAAQMVGLAQGAFDATTSYLHERKQFGKLLNEFQGIRFQHSQLATEIEAARVMTYNAAALKEAGYSFVKEAAMAKLYASQMAARISSKCVDLLGGNGFTADYPVEKFFRDAKIGAIYEGTDNIQLETIAKCLDKEFEG